MLKMKNVNCFRGFYSWIFSTRDGVKMIEITKQHQTTAIAELMIWLVGRKKNNDEISEVNSASLSLSILISFLPPKNDEIFPLNIFRFADATFSYWLMLFLWTATKRTEWWMGAVRWTIHDMMKKCISMRWWWRLHRRHHPIKALCNKRFIEFNSLHFKYIYECVFCEVSIALHT